MHTRRWHRVSARIVLATFSTCFVACGGPQGEAPTPTTVPAAQPPPTPPPTEPPTLPPTLPPPSPTLPSQAPAQLGKQELRDLVAPVALYPDVVLASLLPASTKGDQVHDAAQYVGQAQHVDQIPEDRGWDGSVVALLQFPDVLRWLDNNPAWTDQMGMAVTYQQADVLQAIQDYRHSVQDVGNLKSNQYQKVSGGGGQDIRIEPAQPSVVYVPSYDPVAAVQPQPPIGQAPAPGVNPWLAFGGGAVVGALGAWALYSIFDDDGHDHRTINTYNNYYYGGGRRPPSQNWQAQQRPYPNRPRGDWQRTRRLDYAPQTRPVKAGAGLRPPMTRPGGAAAGAAAPTPQQVQREQRQQRQAERQHQQEMRQQQQQQRTQKLEQRQQRQAEKQRTQIEQRQQRQAEKQQNQAGRQQKQAEQRQQQQEQRQQRETERQRHQAEHQQLRQERQKAQQEQRQQRQEQQQEQRQQHQEQRQEQRQQRQEERQQRQEQHKQQAQEQGGKKKKKQGQ